MATTEVRIMVEITTVATATTGGIISPFFAMTRRSIMSSIFVYRALT